MATATLTARPRVRVRTVEPWLANSASGRMPNPEDYKCDSDYLHAVPGMVDKILAARNAPLSEDEDVPEEWRHV